MYTQCCRMILLCCSFMGILVSTRACIYEECQCADAAIICQDRGLSRIPPIFGTHIDGFTSLNIGTNNVTQIPAGSLPPGLIELFVLKNPISIIDDTAFDQSSSTLEALSFSEAQFSNIPNAFLHLKTLKYLTIYDTNIVDWNEDFMNHTGPTLKSLVLENVGLTVWPSWIRYFSRLTELSLSDGSISSIPDNALDKFITSLTTLSLHKNSLTTVPKAISTLKSLLTLDLHDNRITDVTWLPLLSQLTTLSLYDNNLTDANHLGDLLQHYGDSLGDIDFHNNQLTSFPNFTDLIHVDSLDFSNNLISDPNSGAIPLTIFTLQLTNNSLPSVPHFMKNLQNVFEMFLASNSINQIQDTDFSRTTTGVYLGFNLLTELTDTSFPENSNIATLQLNNNPIAKISSLALSKLPRLMDLNLQSTKLTRLPVALVSLNSLRFADFTNSASLICTCAEKALEPWVSSIQRVSIVGYCGETSIYDFFLNLSPSCPS